MAASAEASAEAEPLAAVLPVPCAAGLSTVALAPDAFALVFLATALAVAALAATALAVAALRGDIDVIPFLHDFVLAQPHLAVGNAFPGLHVVFHAVPGADEMQLGVREVKPARGLVRHDPLFDLGDG